MKAKLKKTNYETLIFEFRETKVMVDTDLALLYGIPTKVLKQQVKRNIDRFPHDFMFVLRSRESKELVTNCDRLSRLKHSTAHPMVFTEMGVSMLSSVLNSEKAIKVNIEIMRAFSKYRALLRENEKLRKEIRDLDDKLNEAFKYLMQKIDLLHQRTSHLPVLYKRKRP